MCSNWDRGKGRDASLRVCACTTKLNIFFPRLVASFCSIFIHITYVLTTTAQYLPFLNRNSIVQTENNKLEQQQRQPIRPKIVPSFIINAADVGDSDDDVLQRRLLADDAVHRINGDGNFYLIDSEALPEILELPEVRVLRDTAEQRQNDENVSGEEETRKDKDDEEDPNKATLLDQSDLTMVRVINERPLLDEIKQSNGKTFWFM